jgi:hypothetical protein
MRDVLVAPDGRVFVCTSNSDQVFPNASIDKIYELRNPAFSIGIDNPDRISEDDVVVSPNPTSGNAFVRLPDVWENVTYELIDLNGRVVQSGKPFTLFSGFEVRRNGLVAGVYSIRLSTSLGTVSKRVVFN